METRICPHCGTKNEEKAWICTNCGENLYGASSTDVSNQPSKEDTGWKCRYCDNNNPGTITSCEACGRDRYSIPPEPVERISTPPPPIRTIHSPSKPNAAPVGPSPTKSIWSVVVLAILGLFVFCMCAFAGLRYFQVSSNRVTQTLEPSSMIKKDTPVPTKLPTKLPTKVPILPVENIQVTEAPTLELESTPINDPDFDWSKCHAKYSTRLHSGDAVVITQASSPIGYHLLSEPYKDKEQVGSFSPGEQARILGGPSCSNGWIWWYIQMDEDKSTGWFPEGTQDGYWISPLESGTTRYATISNEVYKVSLRKTPGFQGKTKSEDVIAEVSQGERVTVISGPTVEDGLNWWRVEWKGYTGWIAEKTISGKKILIFP
jgi:hypothetical protein